jgi:hypothetical protein
MNPDRVAPIDPEASPGFAALEQRLGLMRALAGSLEQAQIAAVYSDRVTLQYYTEQQRSICEAVRRLETASAQPMTAIQAPARSSAGPRWEAVAQELREIEHRVWQLNRVHGALLRRAGRTLEIFRRVLESSALTYSAPLLGPAVTPPTLECEEAGHV